MPAMIDTIRGLLEGMAKEHIDNQDAIISFDTNMKKIVEYSKSDPPIDESIKSLTELYQNPDTKQLIKDTKEPPNINSVLDEKKLKDYIFSKIIDYFESITNVPENKDYIKVFNLLTGIEDVKRPDMVAGNNNKTKNNKKSNKNKTKKRKRKNSSNRKFKFAKVKKI